MRRLDATVVTGLFAGALLIQGGLLWSCGDSPSGASSAGTVPGAQSATNRETVEVRANDGITDEYALTDPSSVRIELSRTACFGTCPVYEVVVTGHGAVQYSGHAYVSSQREHVASISSDKIQELLAAFRDLDFFRLEYEYVMSVTCMPSTIIQLTIGERSHRVRNYWAGEWDLQELEAEIAAQEADGNADLAKKLQDVLDNKHIPHLAMHRRLDALAAAIDQAVDSQRWVGVPLTEEK